jgi:hypothetical protein
MTPVNPSSGIPEHLAPGQTHTFTVQWEYSNGGAGEPCDGGVSACLALLIDGTPIGATNFNPYGYWGNNSSGGQNAWLAQFEGETHYYGTDMPGENTPAGYTSVFSAPEIQNNNSSNNFSAAPCDFASSLGSSNPRYGINYATADGCQTWSIYTYAGS